MHGGRAEPKVAPSGATATSGAHGRIAWIDVARGIGIIAVVVGHVWTRGAVRDAVYSFHMPFFFLLSGYLFSPKPPGAFARRQITGQGLSYLAFLMLVLSADLLIEGMRGHRPIFHNWPGDMWRVAFGGSELRGPFTVFWFVPCLVAARIAFNGVTARFPNLLGWEWRLFTGASLIVAYRIGAGTDVSPLGLLTAPMAFALLWMGAALRRVVIQPWMWGAVVLLAVAGLFLLPTINMKAGDYGWPVMSIAAAVATSLLIFRTARMPLPGARVLSALGSASLVIMYLHVPVIHYLSPYLGKGWLLVLALGVPAAAYYLFNAFAVTRRLFLAQ